MATVSASYYSHSGRYSRAGVAAAAATSAAAAALLAVVYAYADLYIPIAGYISFLLAGAFGLGMGLATGFSLRLMKVRNTLVANLVVAGVAAFGLYLAWAVWTYALLARSEVAEARLAPLIYDPLLLGRVVAAINESGAWSLKGFTPTGFVLALFWMAEAGIVFLAAVITGVSQVSSGVFCESCESWCEKSAGVARLGAQTPGYLRRKLEERDFPFLARLGLPPRDAAEFFRLDLHSCQACASTHAVTVEHVRMSKDKNGKLREETAAVVDRLLVSRAEGHWLRAFGEGRSPLPPLAEGPSAGGAAPAAPAPGPAITPVLAAVAAPRVVDPALAAERRRMELGSVKAASSTAVERVGSAIRIGHRVSGPNRGAADAGAALRFAAFRAVPSATGLQVSDRSGAQRELAWEAVREAVAQQLPADPPWDSAIVVDFVPADGSQPVRLVTGSFISWKALPGGAATSPVENVRRLLRFAVERNPQIALEASTRAFCLEGQPLRRLMGMRPFAEYDARYG